MSPGGPADIFDNMFGRPLAAVRLRVHVRSFVYDENRTLLNSQLQFCAIGADPGQNENQLADWQFVGRLLKRKNYSDRSFPTRVWKNWLSVFGEDQCSFYLFDDIAKRPDAVLTRLGHKFGFDPASIRVDPDHNRKAGSKKVDFTSEINEKLHQYFYEEIKKMVVFTGGQI